MAWTSTRSPAEPISTSPEAAENVARPPTREQRRQPDAVDMRSSPPTDPTVTSPLAVLARTSFVTSSVVTSPLAVFRSAAPSNPVTSTSADPVTAVTLLPSGRTMRMVTPLRRRNRMPCSRGSLTITVSLRCSTVARSTSSSAPGVSGINETSVVVVSRAVIVTVPTSFST